VLLPVGGRSRSPVWVPLNTRVLRSPSVATILGRGDHRASSSSGPASNRHTAGVSGLRPKAPLDWQTKHRALLLPSQTWGVLGPPCIRRRPIVIAGPLHGVSCPWCGHCNRVAGAVAVLEAITAGITPCVGFTGHFAFSPAFRSPVPRPLGALSCCRRLRPVPLVRPPHTARAWRRPVFLRDLGVARQEHCPASLRRVRAPSARPAAMSQSSHWPL